MYQRIVRTITKVRSVLSTKPINFSFVDEYVCGSSAPASKRQINWLRGIGVRAILSLNTDPIRKVWMNGIENRSIPIPDHSVPSIDLLKESVDFIILHEERKEKVLVHCDAGKGRTGTVLAAYFCRKYGLTSKDAIDYVRARRPGSVERAQRKVVEEYRSQISFADRENDDRIEFLSVNKKNCE